MKYLKLLRVGHYIKNFMIFLPLFFSRDFFNASLLQTIAGFFAFCFISSCVYIVNDIRDAPKDRRHPVKRFRPIASGEISRKQAAFAAALMAALSMTALLVARAPLSAFVCLGAYVLINLLYSFGLKNVPLVDIAILTSGFVIRVFYGALLSGKALSEWMYLTIMMASLFAASGKRRNELAVAENGSTRPVLKKYNYVFLDKCMYLAMTCAIVFYSLWILSEYPGTPMIASIPMILFICLSYSMIVEGKSLGDPVEVILHSPGILILGGIWALFVAFCLYD